jgi:hypothetical protein
MNEDMTEAAQLNVSFMTGDSPRYFLDACKFLNPKEDDSIGQRIIVLFHFVLFFFLCGVFPIDVQRIIIPN